MSSFYDIHATDFSRSRFCIWPHVKQFLDLLPVNATVLDIGCGNGKNMMYRRDLNITGIEHSDALVKICNSRNLRVIQGDARKLPFKDCVFDAVIMIAVIHHIHPDEQNQVLNEIKRVLRPGGTCLITNWAVEQPSDARRTFKPGLNIIRWKGKDDTPLTYWVMDNTQANNFISKLPENLTCNLSWDTGNWEFWIQKVD